MSQHQTSQEASKDLKPIELKNGHCSGARFFTYSVDKHTYLRKTISGETHKLEDQYEWLKSHSDNPHIPKVFNPIKQSNIFSYDMPFFENSKNAYQLLKINQLSSLRPIVEALDSLKQEVKNVSHDQVRSYLSKKLMGKIDQCIKLDKELLIKHPQLIDLVKELCVMSPLLEKGENYNIHGDATLENILINEIGLPILIDPNGENTVSSFEVEMGKIFQSLNSHYEDLTLGEMTIQEIQDTKSHPLLKEIQEIILERGGDESLRKTYFHEIIHIARLLPYKKINQPEKFESFIELFIMRSEEFLSQ